MSGSLLWAAGRLDRLNNKEKNNHNEETDDSDAWPRISHDDRGRYLCPGYEVGRYDEEKERQKRQEKGRRYLQEPVLPLSLSNIAGDAARSLWICAALQVSFPSCRFLPSEYPLCA